MLRKEGPKPRNIAEKEVFIPYLNERDPNGYLNEARTDIKS